MPDEVEPIVRGIQKRFRDLSVDVREERIIRYIVKQLGLERRIDDIMSDPYMTAHTSEVERAQILQNPAVIRALEEEIQRQFATYRSATVMGAVTDSTEMIVCPSCRSDNTPDSNYCRRCGNRLKAVDAAEITQAFSLGDQDTGAARIAPEGVIAGPVLLIRTGGGREGEVIALGDDVLTVGRSPHSDLFLDDVTVSRHHARIIVDDMGFTVEDLNSLNGTYINRKRIERHHLRDGDELQIGKFKLVFLEQEHQL
jgi:ribosomal protein L40E